MPVSTVRQRSALRLPWLRSLGKTPTAMRERFFRICLSVAIFVFIARSPYAAAATLTGMVIGEGARPVAGALVQVGGSAQPCETRSGADGTFTLACDAAGV